MIKKFKKNDNCIKRLLEKNRRKYDACFDENEYIRFNEVLSSLREENNKLCKKFKIEEEIENEYMNQLSVTRDMKKKSVNTREKEQQLREQTEISDAESKVQELLSKTQEEEKISISELSGIELAQIATLDTKKEPSFS